MQISEIIAHDKELDNFIQKAPNYTRSLLTGTNDGAFSTVILQILKKLNKPLLIVEENEDKAQRLQNELSSLLNDEIVHMFPVDATIDTQSAVASPDELSQRLDTLNFLRSGRPGIVVTVPQGLQYQLSDPEVFSKAEKIFAPEKEYDLPKLTDWLLKLGYQRESLVARPGEFALRGDILDIYPLNSENPFRIEFFGDEIDTIKEFDPATQRSLQERELIAIGSAIDRIFKKEDLYQAAERIKIDMKDSIADKKAVGEHFEQILDKLENGGLPENYAFLVDYLIDKPVSLLDYLASDGLILYDDWTAIKKNIADINARNESFISEEIKAGAMLDSQNLRMDFSKVTKKAKQSMILLSLFQKGMGRLKLDQINNFTTRQSEQFFSQMPLIKSELISFHKENQTVVLQADNKERARQIDQNLTDYGLDIPIVSPENIVEGRTQIIVGNYTNGFTLPSVNLVYLTERELFNQKKRVKKRIKTMENAQRLRNYNELKPGDYVVHVNHGIGRFEGIKTLENNGVKRDYITITYQLIS